jgi:hypothetical protein
MCTGRYSYFSLIERVNKHQIAEEEKKEKKKGYLDKNLNKKNLVVAVNGTSCPHASINKNNEQSRFFLLCCGFT